MNKYLMLLCSIALCCSCFFFRNKNEVFINPVDGPLTRQIYAQKGLVDSIIISYDNGRMYKRTVYRGLSSYYYTFGRMKRQLEYENGLERGAVLTWYKNGQLQDSVYYIEGKKIGIEKKWFEDGQLSERIEYRYTIRSKFDDENFKQNTRPYKSWYPNGQLKDSLGLLNVVCCGVRKRWYDTGELKDSIFYSEGSFINGIMEDSFAYSGPQKGWEEVVEIADLTQEAFEPGIKHGTQKSWYRNGQLQSQETYELGQEVVGSYTEWDSTGTCRSKWFTGNDPNTATLFTWYPNGKVKSSMRYYLGTRDSLATYCYPSGKVKAQLYYSLGRRLTEKEAFWTEQGKPYKQMDAERIYTILYYSKYQLMNIYQNYFKFDKKLHGSFTAALTITPRGTLMASRIISSTTKNMTFDQEIMDKLEKFDFGGSDLKENLTVIYKFAFFKRISAGPPPEASKATDIPPEIIIKAPGTIK